MKVGSPEFLNMLAKLKALCFYIEAIEKEDDPEVIALSLECLEYLEDGGNVKEKIRQGFGDYAKLTQKCTSMGLI